MASNGQVRASQRRVELNGVESDLRRLLLDVARYVNPAAPSELRFTGGWVRDKLLGKTSKDVDVAINDMTGYQFGLKMKEYLDQPGNAEKYGIEAVASDEKASSAPGSVRDNPRILEGLHKIQANPERSKHLETVTTRVFGLDIDLVNLRKETYSEVSRNPDMEFGTPEEDALRRDATVNALFYNLNTEKVEDLTGQGYHDMDEKIIRTPLEPYQTFKDDPLRVLRLVRFASRLDYAIDAGTKEAMKDSSIKEALKLKISRERVGIEVEKMLKGPNPHMALHLIDELGLYATIFSDPTKADLFVPDVSSWKAYYDTAASLEARQTGAIKDVLLEENDAKYHLWLLAAFTPLADAPSPQTNKGGGKTPPPYASIVAREGIKATNKVTEIVVSSVLHAKDITSLKDKFVQRKRGPPDSIDPAGRDTLGMAIRRWGVTWKSQAIFALLLDSGQSQREVAEEWESFLSHIQNLGLVCAFDFKTVIDGTKLAQSLNTPPGPWMKNALDVVMAWQLRNPKTATADGAVDAVKENWALLGHAQGELTEDLITHFLQLTIRPLFSKTQQAHSDTVTPQGRKVENAQLERRKHVEFEDEAITRPWKEAKYQFSLDLFKWVLWRLNPNLAEKHWHLLVPPLLTLLDDVDTKYKARGCDFLSSLLKQTPPSLLSRTGLGPVFEDALKPSLSYLPTLTPESESISLLNSAYPALLTLSTVRFPEPVSSSASTHPAATNSQDRTSHLSLILHQHLLPSIAHIHGASSSIPYPQLLECLFAQLRSLLSLLAIDTVAHLVYLIPTVNEILTSPFATLSVEGLRLMTEAMRCTQTVIANAWVRMDFWHADMLMGLCAAWIRSCEAVNENMNTELAHETVKLQIEVRKAVAMLVQAVDAVVMVHAEQENGDGTLKVDIKEEVARLAEADHRLETLFSDLVAER